MATGTAFVSEYFDKRTQGAGPRADQAPAFGEQETPPSMYLQGPSKSRTPGRGTVIVSMVFRALTLVCVLIALAILASSTGKFGMSNQDAVNPGVATTSIVTARFTTFSAFKYLFAACVIVAVYSLAMVVVDIVSLVVSGVASSKILLVIIFVCDQVLAYFLISAAAVGANGVMASYNDENLSGFQGVMTCKRLGITGFCNKVATSVGLAFLAFLFLATTSVLSTRRLFRP